MSTKTDIPWSQLLKEWRRSNELLERIANCLTVVYPDVDKARESLGISEPVFRSLFAPMVARKFGNAATFAHPDLIERREQVVYEQGDDRG